MKGLSLPQWLILWALAWLAVSAKAEGLGPASKRTGWVVSEIMYHPADRPDGKNLEFIEIYNSSPWPEDLSGYQLRGEVDFIFPDATVVPALGFAVVAGAPADLAESYGLPAVLGPFANNGKLSNNGGRIELWSRSGALLLEVAYKDSAPWPVAADGLGHSLVLARPSYGQGEAKAWSASAKTGGSPGKSEPALVDPLGALVINEILAHTDEPALDFIEIYNHGSAALSLAGCVLTDDPATNRFVIGNLSIPANGFLAFDQNQLGFRLHASGETVLLKNPAGDRVLDAVSFGAQENGVAWGRFPNGANEFYRLTSPTPGATNSAIRIGTVVINELMYDPLSGDNDQYVELFNSGAAAVDLSGWRLGGGVDFTTPTNVAVGAGGYVVIAKNRERLIGIHTNLTLNNTLGNFLGRLAHGGDRVTLSMPEVNITTNALGGLETNTVHILVDEVTYGTGGRWGQWANGGGSSLELVDARGNHRLAANWADSDETTKAGWTRIETTGTLDNGSGATAPDQLQMILQDAGECLVDNVEVVGPGGNNSIANATLESGVTGWTAGGTLEGSGLESSEGFESTKSYHMRAVGRGDTGANRVTHSLSPVLAQGNIATIRARARWLRGSPELLLRLRGNSLEAIGTMDVPLNLGTPGRRNSRARSNAEPAIYDVNHGPVLPAANQAVLVTARVEDPDAPLSVALYYRLDPSTVYKTVPMSDDGTGDDQLAGDGIYTGKIPGAATGTMIAFFVQATDAQGGQGRFPSDAPDRQCLVRVGETQPAGSLGTYRLWMTQATASRWTSRSKLNNAQLDVTFVYGNERVIYNMGALFAGSPYISPGYTTPNGALCGYTGNFPKDDLFLGTSDFVLDWPGRDQTAVGENLSYWIADQLNLPNSHRRFIHLHVNGQNEQARGSIYEDVQQPGGDMVKEWFPDDADGKFYKIERWFEFSDSISLIDSPAPTLGNFTTTGGVKKRARYRWNWLGRAVSGSPNDFNDLYALVDAVNASVPETYTSQTLALADVDEMMGIFAVERIINNFDSWGHQIGKNMYAYKPPFGRWSTFMFDNDWLLGSSAALGYSPTSDLFTPCEDPAVARMYSHPPFRRAFFRAMRKAVDGPLKADQLNPRADAMSAALVANGVTRSAGGALASAAAVKTFLQQRRDYILTQLAAVSSSFAITSNGGADYETATNLVTLTGTAPIEVVSISVNGVAFPVQWTDVTAWSLSLPLQAVTNTLNLEAVDQAGAVIAGGTDSITVIYRGALEAPKGRVVFNEIMYNPSQPGASFVELFSTAETTTFDLSNWRIAGIDFVFPQGTILPPGGLLVVAKDRAVFASVYGTSIPVVGEFLGLLRNGGETLWLIQPGQAPEEDVVIDQVTYSDSAPWPTLADGTGASLQLVDAAQDNSRALNWAATAPMTNNTPSVNLIPITQTWRYDQSGADLGTAWIGTNFDDSAWPAGPALLYVETAALPAPKSTPLTLGVTTYYFRTHFNFNGSPASINLNLTSVVDDGAVFYLNGRELYRLGMPKGEILNSTVAGRLVGDAAFEGPTELPATDLLQGDNVLSVEVHQNNTGSSDIVFGMALEAVARVQQAATPGSVNSVVATLSAFPSVWVNEIEPVNITGITNELGQHEPWAELYNAGETTVSLRGWYLADSTTNLTRWAFPADASIGAGQFLMVWLDGGAAPTTATSLHANFRPTSQDGTLALVFPFTNGDAVLDYVNYRGIPNDRSFGRYPDGFEGDGQLFYATTPGTRNDNRSPALPLFINEWMASNQSIADPSDQKFDDWFELYNPNSAAVDLAGYSLTDNLADTLQRSIIPNGFRIEAHGFLLVWADNDTPVNATELHVPFKLDRTGDNIGLYAPNGSLVDSVTFSIQTNDVSQGRWPDGGTELRFFTKATPRASNVGVVDPVTFRVAASVDLSNNVVIRWNSEAGHVYRIQYKRDLGQASWSDLNDVTATGSSSESSYPMLLESQRYYRVLQTAP